LRGSWSSTLVHKHAQRLDPGHQISVQEMVWGLETLLPMRARKQLYVVKGICSFISRDLLEELVPAGDAAAVSQHLPEGARGAEERGKEQQ